METRRKKRQRIADEEEKIRKKKALKSVEAFRTTRRKCEAYLVDEEDKIIRKIFLVTLVKNKARKEIKKEEDSSSFVVFYLEMIAKQLLNEGKPLKLRRDLMAQVLCHRYYLGRFHGAGEEPLFPYLIGCYRRAYEEERQLPSMEFSLIQWAIKSLLNQAKKLIVSYCSRYLVNCTTSGMFFESPLLPLLLSEVSSSNENHESGGKMVYCPPGFFKQLLEDSDFDSLKIILKPLYKDLSRRASKVSLLGDFQQPLLALIYLVKFRNGAEALVNHPRWLPKDCNGIEIEKMSILGPFFHPSILPDDRFIMTKPDVRQGFPSDMRNWQSYDRAGYRKTIRTLTNELHGGLEEVLLILLENNDTREKVLEYIAEIIEQNSSIASIIPSPTCASLGMLVNLSAVMLRLCKTFFDEDVLRKSGEINGKYVFDNTRLDFSQLSSLHASPEEVATWMDKEKLGNKNGSRWTSKSKKCNNTKTKYTFLCECFFMTARVLHLGLIKALSEMQRIDRKLIAYKGFHSSLKPMLQRQDSSSDLQQHREFLERKIVRYSRKSLCYSAQILQHKAFLEQALSFYRLMLVWLVDLVGGGFRKALLPITCPMEFACMPEHFVEDAVELLIVVLKYPNWYGRTLPVTDEFVNFIIMFMSNPHYIRNSYIREKMVEVLSWCIDKTSTSITIFEDNQLCLEVLVPNLLQLYVGNEIGSSSPTQVADFRFRNNIIRILKYLWKIPSYCNAWRKIAEEDTGFYSAFLNSVINEIMFQLDRISHSILALDEMKAEMSSSVEWENRNRPFERKNKLYIQCIENMINDSMSYVMATVGLLALNSEQIIVPFLLPHMVDIVATVLNYILSNLVSFQQKIFHLKKHSNNRNNGDWQKILLKQIIRIYVHLARRDGENEYIFPVAIGKDSRSYSEHLFTHAAELAVPYEASSSVIQEFQELGARVKLAASKAMDTEASLGEIPNEFLDPIEFTLMEDPVTLPSTKTVNRSVILRHLLNYDTDPFTALPLTEDMITPNVELKAKIEKFIESKQFDETRLSIFAD